MSDVDSKDWTAARVVAMGQVSTSIPWLNEVREELEQSRARISTLEAENARLRADVVAVTKAGVDLQARVIELTRELVSLRADLEREKAERDQLAIDYAQQGADLERVTGELRVVEHKHAVACEDAIRSGALAAKRLRSLEGG